MMNLQQECFTNIKSLCNNFGKDPADRKNENYLITRLKSLESQWSDFEARHNEIVEITEDKNIHYFTEDVFNKTKILYEKTRKEMNKLLLQLRETEPVFFDVTGMLGDSTDPDLKSLLEKQECNFKALDRVMSKIDVNKTMEKWELEDHLSVLRSKWDAIDRHHWELDTKLEGTNSTYYTSFVNIEDKYDELKRKLNSKIWSSAHYEKSTPKVEVPEFSGSYTQWISFKDLFLETIHTNPVINKAQKMQHLKTRLRGEAERLVQHLGISADNYNACWDILTQRYDNRRLQFTSFVNTMLNLPVIQQPESNNLKKMHDVITECLNGLANIGLNTTTWDPLIIHLMSQKLDATTYTEYMKDLQDHRELPNLNDFLYFLESKFMAYESMKNAKKEVPNIQKPQMTRAPARNSYFPRKHYETPRKSYTTNFGKTYFTTIPCGICPHCRGPHVLMQCSKFIEMNAVQRNNTVRKLRVCANCLYEHADGICNSAKTCKYCNLGHHTLLHNDAKNVAHLPGNGGRYNPNRPSGSKDH